MITLTQLEYIVAIDEYRHFATAGERCFVTQPTLSIQVKKLEDELGVIIFDRSRQPVVPTDIGAKLIEQARITLASAERIKEIIREEQQDVEGRLKIGIIPTLAPYLLPVFVGHYLRKYPAVKLEIEELVSEEIIRRLKHDAIDVGIFVTPYEDEKIVENPIFYEEMLVYAHPDHELLKKKEISLKDIATPEIWMLGDGHCFRDQVVNLCAISGEQTRNLPFEFESNSLETLMRIVDVEGGFTLIPELALQYMPEAKKQQVKSFSKNRPLREVSVIYSRHYTKQKLIHLLCNELQEVIPAHMLEAARGVVVKWQRKGEILLNKHTE